jgi:hypothetical protein
MNVTIALVELVREALRDGTLDDRDDDALRPPLSRGGRELDQMLEAPANPRHSDGTSRIGNQKVPVTSVS